MNSNTKLQAARNWASDKSYRAQAAVVSALALSPLAAMAQDAGVDTSTITAKISENTGKAVAIAALFIVGVWALKSMGLFKRG